jgi:hypothetical protein
VDWGAAKAKRGVLRVEVVVAVTQGLLNVAEKGQQRKGRRFRWDQENQEEVQTMAVAKMPVGRRVRKDLEPTAAAETAAQGRDRKVLLREAL